MHISLENARFQKVRFYCKFTRLWIFYQKSCNFYKTRVNCTVLTRFCNCLCYSVDQQQESSSTHQVMLLHHRRAISSCFGASGDAEFRIPSPPPPPQSIVSAEVPITRLIVSQWRKMKYTTLMLIKRSTGTILQGWDAVVGSSSCAGDLDDVCNVWRSECSRDSSHFA